MPRGRDYKDDLLNDLRNDKAYAAEYLSAAYGDSREAFLVAMRDVVQAQDGFGKTAAVAGINRESLYRTLSDKGNPRFNVLSSVLDALGFRIKVELRQICNQRGPRVGVARTGDVRRKGRSSGSR